MNQLSRDEQEMLKTKHKAAEEADKKVVGGGDELWALLEESWHGEMVDRLCSVMWYGASRSLFPVFEN